MFFQFQIRKCGLSVGIDNEGLYLDCSYVHGMWRLPAGPEEAFTHVLHVIQDAAVTILVRSVPEAYGAVVSVQCSQDHRDGVVVHRNKYCVDCAAFIDVCIGLDA